VFQRGNEALLDEMESQYEAIRVIKENKVFQVKMVVIPVFLDLLDPKDNKVYEVKFLLLRLER
jgi:hypothetical protein